MQDVRLNEVDECVGLSFLDKISVGPSEQGEQCAYFVG